jgi:hypothetical protein
VRLENRKIPFDLVGMQTEVSLNWEKISIATSRRNYVVLEKKP